MKGLMSLIWNRLKIFLINTKKTMISGMDWMMKYITQWWLKTNGEEINLREFWTHGENEKGSDKSLTWWSNDFAGLTSFFLIFVNNQKVLYIFLKKEILYIVYWSSQVLTNVNFSNNKFNVYSHILPLFSKFYLSWSQDNYQYQSFRFTLMKYYNK